MTETEMGKQSDENYASTGVLYEDDKEVIEPKLTGSESLEGTKTKKYVMRLIWPNITFFGLLHLGALYGLYLMLTSAKFATILFAIFLYHASALGITAGVHRLWAHRAYKATWQLRLLLMIMNTVAFQATILYWARDHRLHHKNSETHADPHNAKRGFFFAHVGWLLCNKHPAIKEKGQQIDVSDLEADPILQFQKKHYTLLVSLFCFILPTVIPVYLWNESWINAYFVSGILRCAAIHNVTWLVNSAAHLYGSKPYDKYINPAQNKTVSVLTLGEGWHNYHHVFPWDYKAAELGNYRFNLTTAFIDFFAKVGWAYDLKTVSSDLIMRRVKRTGDGTHDLWGWGDKDQTAEDRNGTTITYQQKND